MPLLAVDEVGVLRRGFLSMNLPLRGREVRRVAVGGERRRDALRRLVVRPLVLDGGRWWWWFLEAAQLLMHRAHRLQSLDRIAVHASVPVAADSRRMDRLRMMRGLKPDLGRPMGAPHAGPPHRHGRHRRGHAVETMLMLVQEAAGQRRGDGRRAADRGCARVRDRDRALQDRAPGTLAALLAHRFPQPRLLRVVHVICGERERCMRDRYQQQKQRRCHVTM